MSRASRPTPPDYAERVYAGVLGKLIGVYLGRPFEGWLHERIERELGEIRDYVHGHPAIAPEKRDNPLVQPDDDLSGTFTFLRALSDRGRAPTAAEVGETWLNYLVEGRSTLWWGGLGLSTEHTAFLRLAGGMRAPDSGSAAVNGRVLSEQIGAQIFADGWAMVAPGDPELAADLARRAASVSHDGEALHGAQVIAAMEALAFTEPRIDVLLDTAVGLLPLDCLTVRLIGDLRSWHAAEPDWRRTRARIEEHYGYDRYGGNCHVIPNHALVVHGLLHGDGDLSRSLTIVCTSGWDTDCNAGNLGCLLGIRNGLAGIEDRWREPVADRLYVSSADGGAAVTDAVRETYRIVDAGRGLAGEPPAAPKDGARFTFALPGSVQGFRVACGIASVENVAVPDGTRALAVHVTSGTARAVTPTFTPPDAIRFTDEGLIATPWLHPGGYALLACPALYPGQTVRARVAADAGNAGPLDCALVASVYDDRDRLAPCDGTGRPLAPGEAAELAWRIPDTGGRPIAEIGVQIAGAGSAMIDRVTWDGPPDVRLGRPAGGGTMWRRAWVPGVERFESPPWAAYQLIQNRGRGLLIQGERGWDDLEVAARIRLHTVAAAGIAARVQGLRRHYALLVCADGRARLVRTADGETVLAEAPLPGWRDEVHELRLRVDGARIEGLVDGETTLAAEDPTQALAGGAVAFVCEEGSMTSDAIEIRPLEAQTP